MTVNRKKVFQLSGQPVPTRSEFLRSNPYPSQGFMRWIRSQDRRAKWDDGAAIIDMIEQMAKRHYLPLQSDDPLTFFPAYSEHLRDLNALWQIAAQAAHPFVSLRERLLAQVTTDDQVLRRLEMVKKTRAAVYGPLIWNAAQSLKGEPLDYAWDYQLWRRHPSDTVSQIISRANEQTEFYKKTPWQKIEEAAPAPPYPQDPTKAQALLDQLDQSQLKPKTKRDANNLGADLIRAATHFWNIFERTKAVDVFRALSNPTLCPDERGQRLLKAALQTFSTVPTTPQAIANYLRKK